MERIVTAVFGTLEGAVAAETVLKRAGLSPLTTHVIDRETELHATRSPETRDAYSYLRDTDLPAPLVELHHKAMEAGHTVLQARVSESDRAYAEALCADPGACRTERDDSARPDLAASGRRTAAA